MELSTTRFFDILSWAKITTFVWQIILVLLATCSSSMGQKVDDQSKLLQVDTDKDFSTFWKVHKAGLRESARATVGYLELENVSQSPLDHTLIYGEYFDSTGRFCFSLVFSQYDSPPSAPNPVSPGEVRELHGLNWGIAPASEPTQLKLSMMKEEISGERDSPRRWHVRIRIPITIGASLPDAVTSMKLNPASMPIDKTSASLIFARLKIDPAGNLEKTQVLRSLNPDVEGWFLEFVKQLTFFPAEEDQVPTAGYVLILIQSFAEKQNGSDSSAAWELPWLKEYSERAAGQEVPPVTKIVFTPPTGKVKSAGETEWTELPPAPPGFLRVLLIGSDWGRPAFKWTVDPSAPHHLRRELVLPGP